jgi:hypothetical protein
VLSPAAKVGGHVGGKSVGCFERREVAASLHLGPALDVERAFGEGARRVADLAREGGVGGRCGRLGERDRPGLVADVVVGPEGRVIAPVTEYSVMLVSSESMSTACSRSPSWSVQTWNFSVIQAASPPVSRSRRRRVSAAACLGCGCSRFPRSASDGVAMPTSLAARR